MPKQFTCSVTIDVKLIYQIPGPCIYRGKIQNLFNKLLKRQVIDFFFIITFKIYKPMFCRLLYVYPNQCYFITILLYQLKYDVRRY